jgi:hypothetical protein
MATPFDVFHLDLTAPGSDPARTHLFRWSDATPLDLVAAAWSLGISPKDVLGREETCANLSAAIIAECRKRDPNLDERSRLLRERVAEAKARGSK